MRVRMRRKPILLLVLGVLTLLTLMYVIDYYRRLNDTQVFVLDTVDDASGTPGYIPLSASWIVRGWKYSDDLTVSGQKQGDSKGFWTSSNFSESNCIELRNFQHFYPLPVAIGFRIYLVGDVTLEIKLKGQDEVEVIRTELSWNSTASSEVYCNHLLEGTTLLETGSVQYIEICHVLFHDTLAHLAVDQVIVSLGSEESHRSLLYSILSKDWCRSNDMLLTSYDL